VLVGAAVALSPRVKPPRAIPIQPTNRSAHISVFSVRSRQERLRASCANEINRSIGLRLRRIRRKGRSFTSYLLLFSGHVFIRGDRRNAPCAWFSGAIVRTIAVADQERLSSELEQIRSLQASGAVLVRTPTIIPGDAVQITEGVFSGYTGVVMRQPHALRVVVLISVLVRQSLRSFRWKPQRLSAEARGASPPRTAPPTSFLRLPGGCD
jgi:hypothetical protein